MSLLTAGLFVGNLEGSCNQRQSMLLCVFFFPALSSYHAVQGWMAELRVHVGEACEFALVDVGDDQLVGRGQHGLRTCEELVEVFCSFAALKEIKNMSDELLFGSLDCK